MQNEMGNGRVPMGVLSATMNRQITRFDTVLRRKKKTDGELSALNLRLEERVRSLSGPSGGWIRRDDPWLRGHLNIRAGKAVFRKRQSIAGALFEYIHDTNINGFIRRQGNMHDNGCLFDNLTGLAVNDFGGNLSEIIQMNTGFVLEGIFIRAQLLKD